MTIPVPFEGMSTENPEPVFRGDHVLAVGRELDVAHVVRYRLAPS